jgi:hypothetical protein
MDPQGAKEGAMGVSLEQWWDDVQQAGRARVGQGPAHAGYRAQLTAAGWVTTGAGWWQPADVSAAAAGTFDQAAGEDTDATRC